MWHTFAKPVVGTSEGPTQGVPNGETAIDRDKRLIDAVGKGNAQEVQKALDGGADIDATDELYEETALHLAARLGHAEVVDILVHNGASLKICDNDGWTPLISACSGDSTRIVQLLLAQLPDNSVEKTDYVNFSDTAGPTALTIACQSSTADLVLLLLEAKADVNTKNDDGDTPLVLAVRRGDATILGNILRYKPNINQICASGATALHEAILIENDEDRERILGLLLDQSDIRLSIQDSWMQTPLHLAIEKGRLDVIKKLLALG
ncbi:ankyrin repeat-containing domain protein [Xylaria sp. FL1777]|nr:ankyrin repeat-containing domain protein [Xylaria sp. FL1777]